LNKIERKLKLKLNIIFISLLQGGRDRPHNSL